MTAPTTKWCGRCREHKPLAEFHVQRSTVSGRTSQCKACRRAADLAPVAEFDRFARISDEDARWLALLIDTEGSILAMRRVFSDRRSDAFRPSVTLTNTSRDLMDEFMRIVSYGNLRWRPHGGLGKQPLWHWSAASNVAGDICRRMYPFLIVKKRQARLAIHIDHLNRFRGGDRPSRLPKTPDEARYLASLCERLRACNHFEHPDLSDVPEPFSPAMARAA